VQNSVDEETIQVKVMLPNKNQTYQLNLFSENFLGSLFLQRTLGDEQSTSKYLTTFGNFSEVGCFVYSPINFQLNCGELYTFRLYVPGVESVALVYKDTEWIYLSAEKDGVWRVDRAFDGPGNLTCYNQNLKTNKWNGICAYEIV